LRREEALRLGEGGMRRHRCTVPGHRRREWRRGTPEGPTRPTGLTCRARWLDGEGGIAAPGPGAVALLQRRPARPRPHGQAQTHGASLTRPQAPGDVPAGPTEGRAQQHVGEGHRWTVHVEAVGEVAPAPHLDREGQAQGSLGEEVGGWVLRGVGRRREPRSEEGVGSARPAVTPALEVVPAQGAIEPADHGVEATLPSLGDDGGPEEAHVAEGVPRSVGAGLEGELHRPPPYQVIGDAGLHVRRRRRPLVPHGRVLC
jgi:hypothetical protein